MTRRVGGVECEKQGTQQWGVRIMPRSTHIGIVAVGLLIGFSGNTSLLDPFEQKQQAIINGDETLACPPQPGAPA